MSKVRLFLFRIEMEGVNLKVYIPGCGELVITSSEHYKSAKHIDGRFVKCGYFVARSNKQHILSSLKSEDPTQPCNNRGLEGYDLGFASLLIIAICVTLISSLLGDISAWFLPWLSRNQLSTDAVSSNLLKKL
ncbi:hypothetical protein CASFOL_028680 [Castilleja foliolosa]|uniref:Uncharacterized protein n=1 Tax=Castilleja foliolosa TaxID=1961234 RepID=A0ABD3CF55_9LAMI